jgi:DNA (cytosine-5)-methyltransferase 1
MRFGSVCSGIEAASQAWLPLGWKAAWLSEIEPFPCSLLEHHYPDTPNFGDMTKFESWPHDDKHAIDLLCGGTPCQSFSVAGLRKGLDDPRGNLMLTFGSIAAKYRPKWLVWENVPGVLSSNGGRDFGAFLGMLGQLGYGFAYRVLDAQYFGVAQRRRRVFVVGCLGDWRSAAAVLFERHSLSGDSAPRRGKGKDVAATIEASLGRSRGAGTPLAGITPQIAKCLTTGVGTKLDFETDDFVVSYGIPGNWIGRKPENGGNAVEPMHDVAPCLTKTDQHGVQTAMTVRRLLPSECEKLQGFPKNYTNVPHRGKPAADGPRYKALGNSWAVPCARWIGERIMLIDALTGSEIEPKAVA